MTKPMLKHVSAVRRAAIFVGAISLGAITPGQTSAQCLTCQAFIDASNSVNANGAQQISETTTQESTAVSCQTKPLDTRFTSELPTPPATWMDENQKRLNTLYCGGPASADIIKSGWAIVKTTVFADGASVTLKVSCE